MTAAPQGQSAELLPFRGGAELAEAAAAAWLQDLAGRAKADWPYCVALSGGRITLQFFAAVIAAVRTPATWLTGVEFFWADERCVPPTDAESSFGAADRLFFQPLGIPPAQIHRIRGEDAPEFAAQQAEAEICRLAPLNAHGQPELDLIFLGMGEDGHVASLFPGENTVARQNCATYRVVGNSPKPPTTRITLGYAAICAAAQVWVLASGPGKEAALLESLKPDGLTPLARVVQGRQRTRIFTDIPLPP